MFDSSHRAQRAQHLPARPGDQGLGRGRAADDRRREAPALDSRGARLQGPGRPAGRHAGVRHRAARVHAVAHGAAARRGGARPTTPSARRRASPTRCIKAGTGTEHPKKRSRVTVHYSGWQTSGKMFDSSVMRGAPATFGLGDVIAGWTEGVQLMVVGEKTRFWIPAGPRLQGPERLAEPACSSSTWSSSAIAISKRRPPRRGATFVADRGDDAHRLDHAVLRHLAALLRAVARARAAARRRRAACW